MMFGSFVKLLVLFVAASLIYYGLTPSASLGMLAKLIALGLGAAIIVPLVYPFAMGIRKGDRINVSEERGPVWTVFIGLSNGMALENGRVGDAIKIELIDKSIAIARISKYEGFFSNAEAKLLQREIPIEIRK
jgi:hypothetical protein